MSLLDRLAEPAVWEAFYDYKCARESPASVQKALRTFIDARAYLPVCTAIAAGEPFALPRRAVISKLSTGKKRVVYTYPEPENTVLKLLTHLLLRRYDGLFSPNLYSFRPNCTAKDAVRRLTRMDGVWDMAVYQADVHDYFNSIPVERLLPMLEEALAADGRLFAFLRSLLTEPRVLDHGEIVCEPKGVMAGTPLSAFYANLYLRALDRRFLDRGVPYARYSDDIILFAPDTAGAETLAAEVRTAIEEMGLRLNPDKEHFSPPGSGWTFLGFRCAPDGTDISPVTVEKLKKKMRRKARALRRWQQRNDLPPEKAAAAFLRVFRRKLLEGGGAHMLTWSRWFFPVITTTESLHRIDLYAQDCLRWLLSGSRTKARYAVRYARLKELGYVSLVHAYYHERADRPEDEKEWEK